MEEDTCHMEEDSLYCSPISPAERGCIPSETDLRDGIFSERHREEEIRRQHARTREREESERE
jgi:hypothetical protein